MKIELEGKVKVIVEKNGKILKKHEQKMNSFLRNFDHILALIFPGQIYISTPAVTLTSIEGYAHDIYGITNPIDEESVILIGSGTKPVSPDDYALETQIALFYVSGFTYDPSNRTIVVRGSWTNNTGEDKTVSEVGLAFYMKYYKNAEGTAASTKYLVIRDLLENSVPVPAGASITVEFTITVKVSG